MKNARSVIIGQLAAAVVFGIAAAGFVFAGADGGSAAAGHIDRSQLSHGERASLSAQVRSAIDAGVPAEDVEIIVARGLGRGESASAVGRLIGAAETARRRGLPDRPVLDRIEQGLAKGIPAERIAAAADRLNGRMQDARPIVQDLDRSGGTGAAADRDRAIETVARALERGIPERALRDTAAQVRERNGSIAYFDRAVGTMAGIADSGTEPAAAARIVQDAVARGTSDKELSKLERDASDGQRKGSRQQKDSRRKDRKEGRRDDREERGREESRDGGSGSSGSGSGSSHGGRGR